MSFRRAKTDTYHHTQHWHAWIDQHRGKKGDAAEKRGTGEKRGGGKKGTRVDYS